VQAAGMPLLAPALMSDIPEVEAAVRLRHADDVLVEIGDRKFYETKVFYADSNFFKVLSFPLISGNENTALKEINTAVITTEFAEKYFGKEDPINKTITVDNKLVEIRGVTGTTGKSHFQFDVLISFETFVVPKNTPANLRSWAWKGFPTYVRLREGSGVNSVHEKLPAFIAKYLQPEDVQITSFELQPIKDVYLHSRNILEREGIATKGDYNYTIGLAAIAAVIMIVACFNFANISTALSIHRVKETGIKRSLGSTRPAIFFQFLFESILNAAVSLVLAIIILHTGLSGLENLLNTQLSLTLTTHLQWLPVYLAMVIFIGVVGGLYPAILLSKLKPQLALKSKTGFHQGSGKPLLRKSIIVFQFFVTAALIATSLSIKRQIEFLQSKDLGYDKEGVVVLRIPDKEMRRLYPTLKNRLSENPDVLGVSASRDLFDGQQPTVEVWESGSSAEPIAMNIFRMYPGFVETTNIEVIAGRAFSDPLNESDSTAFMMNEAAVKTFGWNNNEVIGRKVHAYMQTGEVIGVVKDFHFSSLHTTIAPLIMLVPKSKIEFLYIRFAPGNPGGILASLESGLKEIAPHLPFDYTLLDEHVDQMYQQDKRLSKLTLTFCGLSVALACLGLYGIISLMAEARAKEIGIRKVLGASVSRITALLSGEFMLLVLIASLIALPVSWYLLDQWLSDFAYRIKVPFDILIFSVAISAALATFAVSFRAIKAALANPIDSIKSE
jgi:putative ABC transport system permease protein